MEIGETREEASDSRKHPSLVRRVTFYNCKRSYSSTLTLLSLLLPAERLKDSDSQKQPSLVRRVTFYNCKMFYSSSL